MQTYLEVLKNRYDSIYYNELVELMPGIKAKMWLYGYQSQALPNAEVAGFCGFVKRGQIFDLKTLSSQII